MVKSYPLVLKSVFEAPAGAETVPGAPPQRAPEPRARPLGLWWGAARRPGSARGSVTTAVALPALVGKRERGGGAFLERGWGSAR